MSRKPKINEEQPEESVSGQTSNTTEGVAEDITIDDLPRSIAANVPLEDATVADVATGDINAIVAPQFTKDEVVNTSVTAESDGTNPSKDLSATGVNVQREPEQRAKAANPYSVVNAPVMPPLPAPLGVSEWQPESAPENKGASIIDPEAGDKEYLYGKEMFRGMGVRVCEKCGSDLRTDTYGHPLCPIGDESCPQLEKANESGDKLRTAIDEHQEGLPEYVKRDLDETREMMKEIDPNAKQQQERADLKRSA